MKFAIDGRTLRMILVGVVIAVVLILVVRRARSMYQYPNATAATKTTSTIQSAAAPSTGVVTITTTAAHGYAAGDVIMYGTPSVAYVVLSTPAPTSTAFSVNAVAASGFPAGGVFKPAYQTLTDALEQCNIDFQNGGTQAVFDQCITDRTATYVTSMCPWTSATPTAASASAAIVTAKATFDTDVAAIARAYNGLKNGASTDLTLAINAARKADITGATRKYLTTVCPEYYVPATGGTAPAEYATWVQGLDTQSVPYYFNASLVKFTTVAEKTAAKNRLISWAKYAASTSAGTAPLLPGCTLYSANNNWKLAQQYGPGTVNTAVTFPWNTAETTCAAPATWTLA